MVVLVAVHNLRKGRADVKGAATIAAARFILGAVTWAGLTHPVPGMDLIWHLIGACGDWMVSSAILFAVYLALEPPVRRRWPHAMVTWNRLLQGRWRDPLVARDVLIGATVGAGLYTVFKLFFSLLGHVVEPVNPDVLLTFSLGTRQWVGAHADQVSSALRYGLLIFLTLFAMRQFLRYNLPAAIATAFLFTITEGDVLTSNSWIFMMVVYMVVYSILAFVLLHSGLVATIASVFFANAGNAIMLGWNWKTWYAPSGIATLVLLASIATWAFVTSLGGRDLFGDEV
jgi:hypothetical protein